MAALQVYSRRGCHLCECLLEELLPLVRDKLVVEVRDIDSRADWQASYTARVPVVEYEGRPICEYRVDRQAIARLLDSLPGNPAI